jgi:hypothetical protein
MRPLNFASQPFRNQALPALLFGIAAAILVAVTIEHAFVLRGLMPARTSKLHKEVAGLEAELDRLATEGRSLKAPPPDKGVLAEWGVLKDLVDRRTFSWTGLFARLEGVLPREVRLLSIAPDVERGQVVLEIAAVARPPQAGLGLVGLLEGRGEFEDVYPVSVSEQEGGTAEFHYTMRYLPGVADEAALVPAAASEARDDGVDPQPDPTAAPAPAAASPAPGAPAAARPVPAPSPNGDQAPEMRPDRRGRLLPRPPLAAGSPDPSANTATQQPQERLN